MMEYIENQKVIELDIEEDEDRAEDLEALAVLLADFDTKKIKYELYSFSDEWRYKKLSEIV